jgi:WD40 repeat protein
MTGSMDEVVKVWDLEGGKPTFVSEKNMGIGTIYTLAACPDIPYVFCAGGSRKDNYLYLWDSRESDPGQQTNLVYFNRSRNHGMLL